MGRAKDTKPADAEIQSSAPETAAAGEAAMEAAPEEAKPKKAGRKAGSKKAAASESAENSLQNQEMSVPVSSIDRVREYFRSCIGPGRRYASASAMARGLGLHGSQASTLYKFLHGAEPRFGVVLDWLDKLGATLQFPDGITDFRDVVLLPVFNGLAGAGAYHPQSGDSGCDRLRPVDKNIFTQYRINPLRCFLVDVQGDSMEPLFSDGCTLLVDSADDVRYSPIDGKIYVVRYNDSVMCKRLKLAQQGVTLCSENPLHKAVFIPRDELDEFQIIGRVRWYTVNI